MIKSKCVFSYLSNNILPWVSLIFSLISVPLTVHIEESTGASVTMLSIFFLFKIRLHISEQLSSLPRMVSPSFM
ncbi:hypothetical protein BpHYR1_034771 [Brachionus plicatilis]|uniref:Uncharacterized protein n=1 Tax=Brachionus plicatilis TaxID=10195 RepID=A0A3M7S1T7_BRAPC|nr:hypothetical protein BpHYR1_034771 [Brachionus plicatilis]